VLKILNKVLVMDKVSVLPGIAFEKIVAEIQAQIDPSATVIHNEKIKDRLGHDRQFDVVIRGAFAGQKMLGVIECKDKGRKLGTPDVDAFVTKAQDVNANFKILMSRSGFSAPAIEKCVHYGIQPLSLLEEDPLNPKFFLVVRWQADVSRWNSVKVTLLLQNNSPALVAFKAEELNIRGKKVLDWFTNHLLRNRDQYDDSGWVENKSIIFNIPQVISINSEITRVCVGISLSAERITEKFERETSLKGKGFYNWSEKSLTLPPNTPFSTDPISFDFSQWKRCGELSSSTSELNIRMKIEDETFEYVEDAIQLDKL
jgi:hypothetical protein